MKWVGELKAGGSREAARRDQLTGRRGVVCMKRAGSRCTVDFILKVISIDIPNLRKWYLVTSARMLLLSPISASRKAPISISEVLKSSDILAWNSLRSLLMHSWASGVVRAGLPTLGLSSGSCDRAS